jgi:hypothetical protein
MKTVLGFRDDKIKHIENGDEPILIIHNHVSPEFFVDFLHSHGKSNSAHYKTFYFEILFDELQRGNESIGRITGEIMRNYLYRDGTHKVPSIGHKTIDDSSIILVSLHDIIDKKAGKILMYNRTYKDGQQALSLPYFQNTGYLNFIQIIDQRGRLGLQDYHIIKLVHSNKYIFILWNTLDIRELINRIASGYRSINHGDYRPTDFSTAYVNSRRHSADIGRVAGVIISSCLDENGKLTKVSHDMLESLFITP